MSTHRSRSKSPSNSRSRSHERNQNRRSRPPYHKTTNRPTTEDTNLFIVNLTSTVSEEQIRDVYKEFGNVNNCRLIKDHETGYNKFCFVNFDTPEEAQLALRKTNGMELNGKKICVEISKKDNKSGGDRKPYKHNNHFNHDRRRGDDYGSRNFRDRSRDREGRGYRGRERSQGRFAHRRDHSGHGGYNNHNSYNSHYKRRGSPERSDRRPPRYNNRSRTRSRSTERRHHGGYRDSRRDDRGSRGRYPKRNRSPSRSFSRDRKVVYDVHHFLRMIEEGRKKHPIGTYEKEAEQRLRKKVAAY